MWLLEWRVVQYQAASIDISEFSVKMLRLPIGSGFIIIVNLLKSPNCLYVNFVQPSRFSIVTVALPQISKSEFFVIADMVGG